MKNCKRDGARSEPQASEGGPQASEGGPRKTRAFIAVDLDDAARAAAARMLGELREGPGGELVRWVRPEALHVTLRFLGDIEPGRVAPLVECVGEEVAAVEPFELQLGAVHLFPTSRRPRVVALGLEPEELLARLAAAVERGVVETGFESEERRFRGHLTLGRIKGRKAPATRGLATDATCPVGEVVLFRSELRREGAKYTPLGRAPLGARIPAEVSNSHP